ncbi:cupin domain-containing protein [Streptomyces acidicola]|uniref:cupin domain-containing protein n=1 Tax=Streptomyces acidicola TaxID=2596892 RepID=UPI0038166C1F
MRRIVTGHDAQGRSVVVEDGVPPRTHDFASLPGFTSSLVWATEVEQPAGRSGEDPTQKVESFLPALGGTRIIVMTLPPDAVLAGPEFDGPGYVAEQLTHSPKLAETFEADGMHTTPTVDYVLVLDGEVWLELDEGDLIHLTAGDVVVQNATRHGWRNKSDKPVTLAAVLIGATIES